MGLPLPLLVAEVAGWGHPWALPCPLQQNPVVGEAFLEVCQCVKGLPFLSVLSQPWFLGTGCLTSMVTCPRAQAQGSFPSPLHLLPADGGTTFGLLPLPAQLSPPNPPHLGHHKPLTNSHQDP